MRNAIFPKFTAYLCISGDEEVHMPISNVSDELARLNGFGNGIFDDSHVSHDLDLGFTSLSTSGMSQALCSLSETNSHAYGQCTTRHQKVVSEASPRDQYSRVIKTKSVKYYMPILLSITNFLNGICWTIYAVIKFDMNIIIPNGLGAILGAVQLILYWWYYKTTNWDVNDDEGVKQEIQLPTKNTTILVETQ